MPKGDMPLGDFAKQLLAGKPKQNRNGAPPPPQAAQGSAPVSVGVKKRFYHPRVYAKISQHISERLKKLGG